MQKLNYEIDEKALKQLVFNHFVVMFGDSAGLKLEDIKIEVKSKQNYKSEWEVANFRARIEKTI